MKHIFIGIDGTANAAFYDTMYGNVYRMNLSLQTPEQERQQPADIHLLQRCWSDLAEVARTSGQGVWSGHRRDHPAGLVNLVANYEEGDKIYVFGFSRGSVAARALTGMISYSGLVRYDSSPHIQRAWASLRWKHGQGRRLRDEEAGCRAPEREH